MPNLNRSHYFPDEGYARKGSPRVTRVIVPVYLDSSLHLLFLNLFKRTYWVWQILILDGLTQSQTTRIEYIKLKLCSYLHYTSFVSWELMIEIRHIIYQKSWKPPAISNYPTAAKGFQRNLNPLPPVLCGVAKRRVLRSHNLVQETYKQGMSRS